MREAGNVVWLRSAPEGAPTPEPRPAPVRHTLADALAAGGILTGLAWAGQTLVTLLAAA